MHLQQQTQALYTPFQKPTQIQHKHQTQRQQQHTFHAKIHNVEEHGPTLAERHVV